MDVTFEKQIARISKRRDVVVTKYAKLSRNSWLVLLIIFSSKMEGETRGLAILDLILTIRYNLVDEMAVRGILGESGHVLLEF